MRLISKKTPFIIAGAEIARRKLRARRTVQKRSAIRKVLGIAALTGGAIAGAKYFSNPRRRWQAREQISHLKEKVAGNGRGGDQVVNVSEEFASSESAPPSGT